MDTRREHGQYWPGNRTDAGGETPAGTDNGKVDRVDLGTLPADATAAEMRTAIRNIQNAIRPLATAITVALCGFVMAQTAPWDGLRGGVHVVTNEQDAVAMAEIARATNGIPAQIAAATNALHTSLAPTISAAATALQPAATNGLPERIDAVTNGLSAYALKTQIPDMPDLSPYALKSEVPPTPDLTGYATKYEVALATNGVPARIAAATNGLPEKIVAATNGIPARIAASTNGMPEKIAFATNALNTSLAPTISAATTALQPAATNGIREALAVQSESLETHSREIARLSQQIAASQTSNTAYRLMSPDGQTYQDATGTVWQSSTSIGTSQWYFVAVTYTNGTTIATNEIPGISSWSIDGEWYGGDVGNEEWIWTLRVPAGGSEYSSVGGGEYVRPSDMSLSFNLDSGDISGLSFARTNTVSHFWSPVDHVLYASSGGGTSTITTNDVCAIVTNEVVEFTAWKWDAAGTSAGLGQPEYDTTFYNMWSVDYEGMPWAATETSETATELHFDFGTDFELHEAVATRTHITRNALGLARLSDLPTLTNGIPEAIGSKASTNEVKLLPVYGGNGEKMTRWRIYRDGVEVTTQVQQPEYYEGEWLVELIEGDMGPSEYPMGNGEERNISWTGEYEDTDYGLKGVSYSATRSENAIVGYTLGGQENKVLAATGITNGVATAAAIGKAAAASSNYVDAVNATINTSLSAISNKAPAVVDTILGVSWVLKATNGVIYAEVEQQ